MKTIIAFAALLSVACAVPAYGPAILSAPIVTRSYAAPLIAAPAPIITRSYAAPLIAAPAPIIAKSYAAPLIAAPAPIIRSYAAPLITKSYAAPVLLGGKAWGW